MSSEAGTHTAWTRVRTTVNWINLSTPLGLSMAIVGGARISRSVRGTYLAPGYRWRFPIGGAFTVGSVILTRNDRDWLDARPDMMRHEDRHVTQYAWCLGIVMVPLDGLAMAWSWLVAGDFSSYNPFERTAGLSDGGYPPPTTRIARRRTS